MREMQRVRDRAEQVRNKAVVVFRSGEPEALASFMRDTYAELDRVIIEMLSEYPPPVQSSCRKGCWYCCHSYVSVSAPEAVYLAMGIKAWWSEDSRNWVDEQCTRRMFTGESPGEVWQAAIVCPLLASGECMAYSFRPFSCRGCNSLDGEACKQAFYQGDAEREIFRYAPQARAASLYRQALVAASSDAGLFASCMPHTTLLSEFINWQKPAGGWLSGYAPTFA